MSIIVLRIIMHYCYFIINLSFSVNFCITILCIIVKIDINFLKICLNNDKLKQNNINIIIVVADDERMIMEESSFQIYKQKKNN